MCTHVALQCKQSGQIIHVFSTHYDDRGLKAREESSKLIRQRAAHVASKAAEAESHPLIILFGDLNSPRSEQGWQQLTKAADEDNQFSFLDAQLIVPVRFPAKDSLFGAAHHDDDSLRGCLSEPWGGSARTFTSFEPGDGGKTDAEQVIDYVLLGNNGAVHQGTGGSSKKDEWSIDGFAVLDNWSRTDHGWKISDHRPVMAVLRLQRCLPEDHC